MEEEIKHQTLGDDEFNKAEEEIHRSPRKYIPVPRVKHKIVKQNGKESNNNGDDVSSDA